MPSRSRSRCGPAPALTPPRPARPSARLYSANVARRHRRRRGRRLRAAAVARQPPRAHRAAPRSTSLTSLAMFAAGRGAGCRRWRWSSLFAGAARARARSVRRRAGPPARPRRAHLLARGRRADVGQHPHARVPRLADVPRRPAPGLGRARDGAAAPAHRPPADGAAPEPEARAGGRPRRRRDARRGEPARHRRARGRALRQRAQGRGVLQARQLRPASPAPTCACASTTAATSCRSPTPGSTSSTADLIQPIHAGAGNLYSREYFSSCATRWPTTAWRCSGSATGPTRQYKLIMRTFLDVFPHTTLWLDGQLMVGAKRPLHAGASARSTPSATAPRRAPRSTRSASTASRR